MAKTVLHLIETSDPDGAERMIVHLATGLGPEYRSEAALIRDGWLGAALRTRGVPVTMLQYRPKRFFPTLRDLVGLIREKQVALLHTHEFFMNTLGLMASRLTGVPLVATVHGKNYYTDRFRRRVAYRLVGRCGQQVVTVSEDLKHFLAERVGIPSDRIRLVPNGIPVDEDPSKERVSLLRKSLSLDHHSKVVGSVGRLDPVKGHRYLIEGAVHVVRRCPRVVFLIVGGGTLLEELQAKARLLAVDSHIRFLGHREDVRDILAICDVFVLPSLSEGTPLALLEAMAAGVPPVATRVGGVSGVAEDGKTGLLVPPADSQTLAESIVRLLEDRTLAKRMGQSAQEVVAGRFSLTRMVHAYQEIYAGLIRKPEYVEVQK